MKMTLIRPRSAFIPWFKWQRIIGTRIWQKTNGKISQPIIWRIGRIVVDAIERKVGKTY